MAVEAQNLYILFLKELIYNPSYVDLLIYIKSKQEVKLEHIKIDFPDEEKLKRNIKFLSEHSVISRDGNLFSYKPSVDYRNFESFLEKFKLAKNMYYDKVKSEFERRAFNIVIMQDKLNEQFENLNKYSYTSSQFRTYYKKKDLFLQSGELALKELGVDSFEIYEIDDSGNVNLSFHTYRKTKDHSQTQKELKTIKNTIELKEPAIKNTPQEDSIPEKKIFSIFPIIKENKVVALLLFGFDNKVTSMIRDNIVELLDGFSLNFGLTLKTVELIQVLEDKVAKRTKDLRSANSQLKKVNEEISIKNKSKLKEIEIGANIQRTVVPDPRNIPQLGPLSLGAIWIPMPMKIGKNQENVNVKEVSGDFYNYYKVNDDEVGIVIADASGHGIPAALLTMMASAAFSFNSRKGGTTAEICSRSNKEVYNAIGDIGYYLTAFYMKINLKNLKVQYTNAGHHKAIIYRAKTGKLEEWDSDGFFIGSFEEAEYGYGDDQLYPGDKVIMATDGIEEARNDKGEFFEEERLKEFILENKDLHAKDFCDKLNEYVLEFCNGQPANDDRTVVVIDIAKIVEESPNVLMEKILTDINLEKYEKAKDKALMYIDKYGESLNVLERLGEIYFVQNQLDSAEKIYSKAHKLFPKSPLPVKELSKIAYSKKEYEKSAEFSQLANKLTVKEKRARKKK